MKIYPWDYRHSFENKFKRYTFTFSDYLVKYLNKLPDSVKNLITLILEGELYILVSELERCESPIEQLLYVVLHYLLKGYSDVYIEVQHEIELNGTTYRVDICIFIGDWLDSFEKCKKLVIECDGHDFHEKTKEQAMRDKKRDRDLIEAGYQVIHFTGSEIFADPFKCAREIRDLINKMR